MWWQDQALPVGHSWVERGHEWCQVWVQVSPFSSCRAWLEPSTVQETPEKWHTLCPCSHPEPVAVHWLWQGQHLQPWSLSSLPPSG